MIAISDYIEINFSDFNKKLPWEITVNLEATIIELIAKLPASEYKIENNIAIHHNATIELGAIIKSPCIISPGCFVAATSYLRGGVFLDKSVIIGPGVEVKTSFFGSNSKAAHLNFIGDSIIGNNVNIEAGAIIANYKNDSADKQIYYKQSGSLVATGVDKFGALVGDDCKIGANAVLVPGTILAKNTIVKRLQLVDHMEI